MKFDINLDVPSASATATRYTIKCGQVEVEIHKLMDKESYNYIQRSGGELGDWLPEYDWRQRYQTKDADRRGFALPLRTMTKIAKEYVTNCETRRQIEVGAKKVPLPKDTK